MSSDCKCVQYDNPLVSKLTRYINTKLGDYGLRLFQLARKWITSNQMSRVLIPSTRDYIELNSCMVSWCRFNRIVFNKEAVWSRYFIVFSISLNTEEFTNISKVLVYMAKLRAICFVSNRNKWRRNLSYLSLFLKICEKYYVPSFNQYQMHAAGR